MSQSTEAVEGEEEQRGRKGPRSDSNEIQSFDERLQAEVEAKRIKRIPRLVQRGIDLGYIVPGHRIDDYSRKAVAEKGWVNLIGWGPKSSGKSADMMQRGFAVFHGPDEQELDEFGNKHWVVTDWEDTKHGGRCWEMVLHHLVLVPREFASLMKEARKSILAWVGWDDIDVYLPRSLYFTDREAYDILSRRWAPIRVKMSNFHCTTPIKTRVITFILEDMTIERLISNKARAETQVWVWDTDKKDPKKVRKFPIKVREEKINPFLVTKQYFARYWERRLNLADDGELPLEEALNRLVPDQSTAPTQDRSKTPLNTKAIVRETKAALEAAAGS